MKTMNMFKNLSLNMLSAELTNDYSRVAVNSEQAFQFENPADLYFVKVHLNLGVLQTDRI